MEDIDSALILGMLDGLSARATITAQNIANANTTGYRPMRVSFEEALAGAVPQGLEAIHAVRPRVDQVPAPGHGASAAVRLDLELATAAATAGRYRALIELLNRQLQIQALAVTGGA